MPKDNAEASIFPKTEWSQLGESLKLEGGGLDRLIRTYWVPLRIFLLASFPSLRNDVEVILQEFAEDRMLKDGWLNRADKTRGRFRDFLKSSLRNFTLDRLARYEARNPPVELSTLENDLHEDANPSEVFDLYWVRTVLAQTLINMETDCRNPAENQPRRTHIWEMFRVRILDPIMSDADPLPYEALVERFGLRSPTDASNMLLSGKRIFKAHLNRVIEEYGERDAATADEVRALSEFVQKLAHGS